MAKKPTIYKAKISLSDMDRHVYDELNLTIAQHPSESLERMMARVLAYCINAREFLAFTTGLSTPDEPDIWARSLDDQLLEWIDVGEPAVDRIKKAVGRSPKVSIYSFNSKSDVWWDKSENDFRKLNASFFRFQWSAIQTLATLVERTMELSISISDHSAFIASGSGECEVAWETLQTTDSN